MDVESGASGEKDRERLVLDRLEDQIGWYDQKSVAAQRWFKGGRILVLLVAALIPVAVTFELDSRGLAAAGAAIVLVEGISGLYKFQENWILYRSTAESLKHEKFLFLARADLYAAGDPVGLLAERIEGLISQEHAKWTSTVEETLGR